MAQTEETKTQITIDDPSGSTSLKNSDPAPERGTDLERANKGVAVDAPKGDTEVADPDKTQVEGP